MTLPAIVDDESKIPEGSKEHYKQQEGGKFILDVAPSSDGYALENVNSLKNALTAERSSNKELKSKLSSFDGITVEEVSELRTNNDLYKKTIEKQGNIDELVNQQSDAKIQQLVSKHKKEYSSLLEKNEQLNNKFTSMISKDAVSKAILENGGDKDTIQALTPMIQKYIKVTEDGIINVIDDTGGVRIGGSDGSGMSVKQLIAEHKQSMPRLWPSSNTSGGGTPPSDMNFSGSKDFSKMSVAEKTEFARKHGRAKYEELLRSSRSK